MNPDEYDLFRHLSKEPATVALDLFRGLEKRTLGNLKHDTKFKENLEIYAEDKLVRKEHKEMRCEMPGQPRSTFLMVFSPDGSKVASTHGNHNIYVTDLKSGKNIKTLVGHPRTPWCIAFHPSSNQIVASGCLGGEVRIWDLSGGSEVWTTGNQSVIASIAFHPNDRILVIATYNELYFWDWSKPEPFVQIATGNPKEKIRYVAFDKLGHKLITGIANSPQTRWERVRAPVPPRQTERSVSPCLLRSSNQRGLFNPRLTPSSGSPLSAYISGLRTETPNIPESTREPVTSFPERERRITASYRNLLREYEQLVQRYLKIYRPPVMVDKGTDPMETNATNTNSSATQTSEPSVSESTSSSTSESPIQETLPSTSSFHNTETQTSEPPCNNSNLMMPSKILAMKRQPSLTNTTQTADISRKHKSVGSSQESGGEKRVKCDEGASTSAAASSSSTYTETGTQTQSPRKMLVINSNLTNTTETADVSRKHKSVGSSQESCREKRVKCDEGASTSAAASSSSTSTYTEAGTQTQSPRKMLVINSNSTNNSPQPSVSGSGGEPSNSNENNSSSGGVRIFCPKNLKRKLPSDNTDEPKPSTSSGSTSISEELLLNVRPLTEEVRSRFLPIIKSLPACDRRKLLRRFENSRERMKFERRSLNFSKKPNRRPVLDTSSDSTSSDDDSRSESNSNQNITENSNQTLSANNSNNIGEENNTNTSPTNTANSLLSTTNSAIANISDFRNFIVKLEQLFMTVLLTEVNVADYNQSTTTGTTTTTTTTTTTSNNNNSSAVNLLQTINSSSAENTQTTQSGSIPSTININSSTLRHPFPLYISPYVSLNDIRNRRGSIPTTVTTTTTTTASTTGSSDNGGTVNATTNSNTRESNPVERYPRRLLPTRRLMPTHHRVSAFMPTRVNYSRNMISSSRYRRWSSYRCGPRYNSPPCPPVDELINYSERERETSEDGPYQETPLSTTTSAFNPFESTSTPQSNTNTNNSNISNNTDNLGDIYNHILQDLESSLNDVRNIRASARGGERTDLLSSFSESLENIMNQSDTILRNLGGSMMMLPNYNSTANNDNEGETRAGYNNSNFYVRDIGGSSHSNDNERLNSIIGNRSVIETDHNYPRNPVNVQNQHNDMSPLMTSLHMTISYIQRQARLLRQQVERINRAMFEEEQLQLIRQLILESLRYIRSLASESRNTGMSSVRQMMAGTRISDSSPYDSQSEEPTTSSQSGPTPSTSGSAPTNTGDSTRNAEATRRGCGRKTYPPSRLFRLHRYRRTLINYFPRRYAARTDRLSSKPGPSNRASSNRNQDSLHSSRHFSPNINLINASSLNMMTRRLEHFLTEQTKMWTRPQEATTSAQSSSNRASTEIGERILALRLHDCVRRMNRIFNNSVEISSRIGINNVVTPDGATRYAARHFLSLIVDGMSKHIEEIGAGNIPQSLRGQIHSVLAMALLLCDLLLLHLVDSIPPPTGMNLDLERESLTSRIDQMCTQMLQNRFSGHSYQLTRSLQHMRMTMRSAYRALGQTYTARRNAMLPNRPESNQRQLLNRYLRSIFRRRQRINNNDANTSSSDTNQTTRENPEPEPSTSTATVHEGSTRTDGLGPLRWSGTLRDLILRYQDPTGEDEEIASSNSNQDNREDNAQRIGNISSNNSDEDTEPDAPANREVRRSVNILTSTSPSSPPSPSIVSSSRTVWSVPSVHVNDVPVSEPPTLFVNNLISHRHRLLAERASELRAVPHMSVLRPRFLHPLYASVNPFEADLDDTQREVSYDCDMNTTVTPNHRIQVWDISAGNIPTINNPLKNVIVSECKIHNDASVDIAKDGTILVTLLPSGGYLNVTNRLGIYSLNWETLGQCLYTTSFEQNAVSVALSPLSRHLVVGLASRRVSIVPNDRWTMARIFIIDQKNAPGDRLPVLRDLGQDRDTRATATNHKSVNCIRWLPTSGQGLIYATNTGQLVMLT